VQLEAEKRIVADLKAEVTILSSKIVALQRDKQHCLNSVIRLCQSMFDSLEVFHQYHKEERS
jgi:hypothetical protein